MIVLSAIADLTLKLQKYFNAITQTKILVRYAIFAKLQYDAKMRSL